ncbi:hypothetical protein OXX80_012955, partial [Metschnikowia pulcherrima]
MMISKAACHTPKAFIRSLATSGVSIRPKRKRTVFTDELNKGPSFDDFVSGKASKMTLDPLELAREDPLQRLPKWLK